MNRLLPLSALLVLAACPPPVVTPPPPEDAGQMMGCDGQPGCACLSGNTCTLGECLGGTCVDCRRGDLACSCRANGTCGTGLRCASSVCETCPAGVQDCPCNTGDTCNTGLTCTSGTCTPTVCTQGTAGCPCLPSDPKCEGTGYCDSMTVCRQCSSDVVGCPCDGSSQCTGGLVCNTANATCRPAVTCAALRTAGTCLANQRCDESSGVDAVCVPNACVAGFTWDTRTSSCTACVSQNCAAEPRCDDGTDAGVQVTCFAQNRVCVQSGDVAYCDTCRPGFAPDGQGNCLAAPQCGTATCAMNEYCDSTSGTPTCTVSPCPAGQAKPANGACQACGACSGEGFNGRVWPFLTGADECVCETIQDYFVRSGGNTQATKCDADGDGWVVKDADLVTDLALRANARCAIRRVDTVQLVDEYGTALSLRSCINEGMVPTGGTCTGVLPLRLLESQRNDLDNNLGQLRMPLYGRGGGADAGGTGRWLEASELNALTKGCVNTQADFNDSRGTVEDLTEVAPPPPVARADDQSRLASFSYFVELNTSSYVPSALGGPYGTLVIRERSRCDPLFPLHYANNDAFADNDAGDTYWRSCDRRGDPTYDEQNPAATYDFAGWHRASDGGVAAALPPAHATLVGPTDPVTTLARNFGLCKLNGAPPADGRWRGMNHHSQFKCVLISSSATQAHERGLTEFGSTGSLVFNRCAARPCSGVACRTVPGPGPQTLAPIIDCAVTTPTAGEVGFVAMKYRPYGPSNAGYATTEYGGGCINEDVEWSHPTFGTYVCPGPEFLNVFSPGPVVPPLQRQNSNAAFGRYSCYGQLPNYLWAPGFSTRAELKWAVDANDTANGFLR